jgi:hypothetical protein
MLLLFVETPRKFTSTAKFSIRDEDPGLLILVLYIIIVIILLKRRSGLTDRKLCSNTFTWCFHRQIRIVSILTEASLQFKIKFEIYA